MGNRRPMIPTGDYLGQRVRGINLLHPIGEAKPLSSGIPPAVLVTRDKQPYKVRADGDLGKLSEVRLQRSGLTSLPSELLIDAKKIKPLTWGGMRPVL